MKELILGGARSGKSRYAERVAGGSGRRVCYLATAAADDAEMHARIDRHRADRPAGWRTVEEPLALAAALRRHAAADVLLLVDCLTLWLSNCLHEAGAWPEQRGALLDTLPGLPGDILLVSNEVGQGIVPLGELARRFVDEAGRLHQDLAALCDRVTFVTAGLPQTLKDVTQ